MRRTVGDDTTAIGTYTTAAAAAAAAAAVPIMLLVLATMSADGLGV